MGRWLPLLAVMIGGCASVPLDGQARDQLYVGVVRVRVPEVAGPLTAVEVKTLGLGHDGALFLGWRAGRYVYARPEDCRLVILVRRAADVEQARTLVKGMEGACIAT